MNRKTFEHRFKCNDTVFVKQNDYSVKQGTVYSVRHYSFVDGDKLSYEVRSRDRIENYSEANVFATPEEAFK